MLPGFILQIIKAFILRQIEKWGKDIDFEKVKADLIERIRKLVPGSQFDDVAAFIVGTLIDLVAEYFKANTTEITAAQVGKLVDEALHYAQTNFLRRVVTTQGAK